MTQDATHDPTRNPAQDSAENGAPVAKRHVVVVEDDQDISGIIAEVLHDDGLSVTTFHSGEAFVTAMEAVATPVDVMIVDIKLGGMDGFEVARAARKRWRDLPVIFISGDLRPLVRGSGRRDLCLMKPFTVSGLRQVLAASGQSAHV